MFFFRDSSEDEELQEFYKNYFAGDVEVGFRKGRYFTEEKSKEKKRKKQFFSKKKKQKKKGKQEEETEEADDDEEEEKGSGEENTNVSNYNVARNINQSNIAKQISQHSSSDGLYYGYQFVKVPIAATFTQLMLTHYPDL